MCALALRADNRNWRDKFVGRWQALIELHRARCYLLVPDLEASQRHYDTAAELPVRPRSPRAAPQGRGAARARDERPISSRLGQTTDAPARPSAARSPARRPDSALARRSRRRVVGEAPLRGWPTAVVAGGVGGDEAPEAAHRRRLARRSRVTAAFAWMEQERRSAQRRRRCRRCLPRFSARTLYRPRAAPGCLQSMPLGCRSFGKATARRLPMGLFAASAPCAFGVRLLGLGRRLDRYRVPRFLRVSDPNGVVDDLLERFWPPVRASEGLAQLDVAVNVHRQSGSLTRRRRARACAASSRRSTMVRLRCFCCPSRRGSPSSA